MSYKRSVSRRKRSLSPNKSESDFKVQKVHNINSEKKNRNKITLFQDILFFIFLIINILFNYSAYKYHSTETDTSNFLFTYIILIFAYYAFSIFLNNKVLNLIAQITYSILILMMILNSILSDVIIGYGLLMIIIFLIILKAIAIYNRHNPRLWNTSKYIKLSFYSVALVLMLSSFIHNEVEYGKSSLFIKITYFYVLIDTFKNISGLSDDLFVV